MLARKQSIKVGDTTMIDAGATNEATAATTISELAHSNHTGNAWFKKTSVRHFIRICSIASLLSVCANTSKTFHWYPTLMLITFIVDIITGVVFTLEIVFKIYSRGFISGPNSFSKDRWSQFDATMVLFIWISTILQVGIEEVKSVSSNQ